MFLVGHAAVGAILASATGTDNPAVAFGIGWLSHYLADFFPHGDEEIGIWAKKGNEVKRLMAIVSVDMAILLAFTAAFISSRGFSWTICMAVVGSAVPDVIWGIEKVRRKRIIPALENFHDRNHNFINFRMPAAVGLFVQAIVTTAMWSYLIR